MVDVPELPTGPLTPELEAEAKRRLEAAGLQYGGVQNNIPTFTAERWYHIKGRGDLAEVRIDRTCQRDKLVETFKRSIIDGKEYEVTAVEAYCIHVISEGSPIGLLVGKR